MADRMDIAEIDPELELTIGPCTLECAGTLNARTRGYVLEALEVVLQSEPPSVDINISDLRVADADGATALIAVERIVREAGVKVHWRGLDAHDATDCMAV